MKTTRDVLGDAEFSATWDRILANVAANPGQRRQVHPEPRPVLSVQCVSGVDLLQAASRWEQQYERPLGVTVNPDRWAENMAAAINGAAGYAVRKYWLGVIEEVMFVAVRWPMLADLQEAARRVAAREGMG